LLSSLPSLLTTHHGKALQALGWEDLREISEEGVTPGVVMGDGGRAEAWQLARLAVKKAGRSKLHMASLRRPIGYGMSTKRGLTGGSISQKKRSAEKSRNSTSNALTGRRISLRGKKNSKLLPTGLMQPFPPLPSCCRRTHTSFTGPDATADQSRIKLQQFCFISNSMKRR
jgi:hypothetical protein